MITVGLDEFVVRVVPSMVADMHKATRETVNDIALAIVTDARKELRNAIGSDQRLSGVPIGYSWTKQAGQKRQRGAAKGGGIKINPYFLEANAEVNSWALIAVRGPAQYIEHTRRGNYPIPKDPKALIRGAPVKRLKFRGSDTYATSVKGGPIDHPIAPLTKAFRRGEQTARRTADATFEKHFKLTWGR